MQVTIPLTDEERAILRGQLQRRLGDLSKDFILAEKEGNEKLAHRVLDHLAAIRKALHFIP